MELARNLKGTWEDVGSEVGEDIERNWNGRDRKLRG